jgi:Tol biopolymer transport system component
MIGIVIGLLVLSVLVGGIAALFILPSGATPTPAPAAKSALTATLLVSPTLAIPITTTVAPPIASPVTTVTTTLPISPQLTLTPTTPRPTVFQPITGTKRVDLGTDSTTLVVVGVDTGARYPIFQTPGGTGYILSAAWSKDGRKLLVSYTWQSSAVEYGTALRIMNEDGSEAKDILRATTATHGAEAKWVYRDSIWSPDGQRIALRYRYASDFGIWMTNADGTGWKRLASSEINDWPRYWSVDGEWVVAVSGTDNQLYGLAVNEIRRPSVEEVKGTTRFLDQRYYPWKFIEDPRCIFTPNWSDVGSAYWICQ